MLDDEQPQSIVVDTHPQIAFSSGLHAGELDAMKEGIGHKWATKLTTEPLVAVDYIATQPTSRRTWYHRLQSTAWAMISEAFSEQVITPGKTTTAVREKKAQSAVLFGSKSHFQGRTSSGGFVRRYRI